MTTSATLTKWGNGVGILIPKAIREEAGFSVGDHITLTIHDGIVQLSHDDSQWTLHELMRGYSGPAPAFIDPGASRGQEIW